MSHTNVTIPSRVEISMDREASILTAERDFWKRHATAANQELANIPKALVEWGECEIKDPDGKIWHLRLDPQKHPSAAAPDESN